jgi:hypothetical protein
MEASRDVFTAPYPEIGQRGNRRAGLSVMLGFLVFIFIIGSVSGIWTWHYFR